MASPDRCPICYEEIDDTLSDKICKNCGMSIPNGRPYYAVPGRGSYLIFCSAKCVDTYLRLGKALLEVGR